MAKKMVKVDLHTHSIYSNDGGITADQYTEVLDRGTLGCIAITDHNRIDFALQMQKTLGDDKIIIGEEISTLEGDLIGLFLSEPIEPYRSMESTINDIKSQGGIVYIPHPFETFRSGINKENLGRIIDSIDVIESANGRAYLQNCGPEAHAWARINGLATFASSDAHHSPALGKTYSLLSEIPTSKNLIQLSQTARKIYARPSFADIIAPKLNNFKKSLKLKK